MSKKRGQTSQYSSKLKNTCLVLLVLAIIAFIALPAALAQDYGPNPGNFGTGRPSVTTTPNGTTINVYPPLAPQQTAPKPSTANTGISWGSYNKGRDAGLVDGYKQGLRDGQKASSAPSAQPATTATAPFTAPDGYVDLPMVKMTTLLWTALGLLAIGYMALWLRLRRTGRDLDLEQSARISQDNYLSGRINHANERITEVEDSLHDLSMDHAHTREMLAAVNAREEERYHEFIRVQEVHNLMRGMMFPTAVTLHQPAQPIVVTAPAPQPTPATQGNGASQPSAN